MQDLQCLGVYTSGGDAPGMNACLRAVVRTALANDLDVTGIRRGYEGMVEGDFVEMDRRSVSNIVQTGGTMLKSARSEAFTTEEGRARAVPTIGYDTALNTAIENIDRIRDTADAHNRLFLVEVMGRDSGFIALNCGIGGGAELILIPETITEMKRVKERILSLMTAQRRSTIVVVAEGDELGGARGIEQALRDDPDFSDIDLRSTILGHTQRGGSPTASDRVLASRLGVAAVEALLDGHTDVMVGVVNGEIKLTPLRNVYGRRKSIDYDLLKLTQILS
ncbi:MAG: 6-phosphofructokinase [Bacteroidetes bacterium QH_7_62_13]|nr:MAG: 6-phosphofructokinase [Bacteroidetes bacterium QH_7_62_13]